MHWARGLCRLIQPVIPHNISLIKSKKSFAHFQTIWLSTSQGRRLPSALALRPASIARASASTLRPWLLRCPSWAALCRALWPGAHLCWLRGRAATPWTSSKCVPASSLPWLAETLAHHHLMVFTSLESKSEGLRVVIYGVGVLLCQSHCSDKHTVP